MGHRQTLGNRGGDRHYNRQANSMAEEGVVASP